MQHLLWFIQIYIYMKKQMLMQTLHVDFRLTVVTNEFCIQEY